MDTALPQKFPFILDRNLAKANCTDNHVCTSCDTVVLGYGIKKITTEQLALSANLAYNLWIIEEIAVEEMSWLVVLEIVENDCKNW